MKWRLHRRQLLILGAALASMSGGCGARTDLHVPEQQNEAASIETLRAEEIKAPLQCIEIREGVQNVEVQLQTTAQIKKADVFFLLDVTASMGEEIRAIRDSLASRIAPAIQENIPDGRIGVGVFGDFPILEYGAPIDFPFELRVRMTRNILEVQGALENIALIDGADLPESQVEALYLSATGEGLGTFVQPSFGCPLGGLGHPCFRSDALPVYMLITDAAMHNGPGNTFPYLPSAIRPRPHTYEEALSELRELGARVMGFSSGVGDADASLRTLATDTETVDPDGAPFVRAIGRRGNRLSESVVAAITDLAGLLSFDIGTAVRDVSAPTAAGEKGSDFVVALRPLRAVPSTGVSAIDTEAGLFRDAVSGTELFYELVLDGSSAVAGDEPVRFLLDVAFLGDGRTDLGTQQVEIVIPARDGRGC